MGGKLLVSSGSWLMLQCIRVVHEGLFVPVLLYDSEAMIWREKERSRMKAEQMD